MVLAVFKVDFHCDGCTEKICKCIKGFKGVEGVKVERESSKLTVVGSMDRRKLLERIVKKTSKKVDRINPKMEDKYPCEKEKKVMIFTTIVLKINLHCEGCIRRIYNTIFKIDGVQQVRIDREKSQVTIHGNMKTKGLAELVSCKIKKPVELLNEKINCHYDAACHADVALDHCFYPTCHDDVAVDLCGYRYHKCHSDMLRVYQCYPKCHADVAIDQCGYHHWVNRDGATCHADVAIDQCGSLYQVYRDDATCHDDVAVNLCGYWYPTCHADVAVDQHRYRYRVDRVYAQIFSDENPNACCIM